MKGRIIGHGKKTKYLIDGQEVSKRRFERAFPDKPLHSGDSLVGWKPIVSDALAVHPCQVTEAREDAIKKGVPTDFTADGRPILRTRQHRKEYMKAYGFFDKDACYSDAQRGSFQGKRQTDKEVRDQYPEFLQ